MKKLYSLLLTLAVLLPWAASAQQTAPYNEGFENISSVSDLNTAGWELLYQSSSSSASFLDINMASDNTYAGLYSLNIDSWEANSSDYVVVGLPLITNKAVNELQITFSYRVVSTYVTVGFLTDANDASTFVAVETFLGSSSFATKTVEFGTAPATAARIAIKYTGFYRCYIDEVEVKEMPTCKTPQNFSATNMTIQDVTFNWERHAQGTENAWVLEYGIASDFTGATSVNVSGNTTWPVYGLTPNTTYYARVKADCGTDGVSGWAGPISVHIGYCQPGPSSVDGNGISNVTFGTSGVTPTVSDNLSMSSPYYFDHSTTIGASFPGGTVDMSIEYATSYTYYTWVWVDWNNDFLFSEDELVYPSTTTISSGTLNISFNVPSTTALGDYRMRIQGADGSSKKDPCYTGTYSYLVDYTLRVTEAPSCVTPSALSLNRSGDQITATWDGTATNYNIDINGTVTNNVTSPHVFTADLSTEYIVKVQANCGSEASDWSTPQSITTPSCWVGRTIEYALNDSYGDGWNGASITFFNGCEETTLTVTSSSNNGTLNVCADYFAFIWNNGNYDDECSFTFTEGGTTLFYGYGDSYSDGEAIYTYGTQTCPKPTALNYEMPEAHQVKLSWTENGTAQVWQICVNGDENNLINVTTTDVEISHTVISGTPTTFVVYTLTGLNPETDYTVKVRANCGASEFSCWSSAINFSTDIACPSPSNLVVGTPAPNQVALSWYTTGDETAWQLCVNDDENNPIDVVVSETGITITNFGGILTRIVDYTLDGLNAETSYSVKVRANCGSTDGTSEWSNLEYFNTAASCPVPVLAANDFTNIAGHSADVAWTGFAQNDSYVVNYRMAEHIYTKDGGLMETFNSLTTASTIPEGWSNSEGTSLSSYRWWYNTSTSGTGATNGTSHDNSKCVRFDSYMNGRNNTNFLQTPSMNFPVGKTMKLSFWWKNPNGGDLSVYISTDGGSTKTAIAENLAGQSAWKNETIELTDYIGASNVTIHFKGTSNYGSNDAYIYLDDVVVGYDVPAGSWQTQNVTAPTTSTTLTGLDPETPYEVFVTGYCTTGDITTSPSETQTFTTTAACPDPTTLQFVSAALTTATIRWTSPLNAWVVAYKAEGDDQYTEVNVTTNPFTIPNLTAATNYTVKVKADCSANNDGESGWSNEISFHTECPAYYPLPYTCDFETANTTGANIMPLCWTRMGTTTNYPYVVNNSSNAHEGTRSLYFYNSSYASYANEIAALPVIDADLNTVHVSFYGKLSSTSTDGSINVGYVTDLDDATTFTQVQTVTLTSTYEKYTVSFNNVGSVDGNIAFQALYNTDVVTIYIDDITVEALSNCLEPTGMYTSVTGTDNTTVRWKAGGEETTWNLQYRVQGENNWIPASMQAQGDSSFVFDQLTPNTTYEWQVQAVCGNNTSEWSATATFKTSCAPVATYSENFDNMTPGVMPDCWTKVGDNHAQVQGGETTAYPHSGHYCFYIYNGINDNRTSIVLTPDLTEEINTKQINLYVTPAGGYGDGYGNLYVGYMTDASNANSFVAVKTLKATEITDWEQVIVPMSSAPNGAVMALKVVAGGGSTNVEKGWYIDDVIIEPIPAVCAAPTALRTVTVGTDNASVRWKAGGEETNWHIQYHAQGENQWSTVSLQGDSSNTFYQLTPGTTYEWQVRAVCGANFVSDWSATGTFTTTALYTVTAESVSDLFGSVDGAAYWVFTEPAGTEITLTAIPAPGYEFTRWVKYPDTEMSTDAVYTFAVSEDARLIAYFMPKVYNISYELNQGSWATNYFAPDTYVYSEGVTLPTAANVEYLNHTFEGWYDNAQFTGNPITVISTTAMGDTTLYAKWTIDTYDITLVQPANGTISSDPAQTAAVGAPVTLTATPNEGYSFDGTWEVRNTTNGQTVDVVNNQFTMPAGNVEVHATFTINEYAIAATANPAAGGTVMGANTYSYGAVATLTATPNTGYSFVNWKEADTVVSTSATFAFEVKAARTFEAIFAANEYTITYMDGNTTLHTDTYVFGANVTPFADPTKECAEFTGWNETIPATMPANDVVLNAQWSDIYYNITADVTPANAGSVTFDPQPATGNSGYLCGTQVTLTATPAQGYSFAGWTVNGQTVSADAQLVFAVSQDSTLVATFTEDVIVPVCEEWTLLTNASDLAVGDQIIIAAANDNVAMSTTQNENNRGITSIVKTDNGSKLDEPSNTVQILTLAEGVVEGTWALNTGNGYLYAASSSKNYLRTQNNIDANASWTVTVANGVSTINANGDYSNKYMRYNQNNSLISCYGVNSTVDGPLVIYKLTDKKAQSDTTAVVLAESFVWRGTTYPASGDYEVLVGTAANGCDSVRVLHLTLQQKVATPTFTPVAGTYTEPQTVTIACATDGANIYYTTDGNEPTANSTPYTAGIALNTNTTVKAIAVKDGAEWVNSDVATAEYTFNFPTYTVTLNPGNGTVGQTSMTGNAYTEPIYLANMPATPNDACTDWAFAGWSTSSVTETTTMPTFVSDPYYPTADITLYAVYQKTGQTGQAVPSRYVKVTSAPDNWNGDYLIVNETAKKAFNGSLTSLDANSNNINITLNNGVIESNTTTDAAKFTIASINTGYSIKSASGYYIGSTTSSNELKTSTTQQYSNTISMNGSDVNIKGSSLYLRYNNASNTNRFRYYSNGSQQPIQLYKYEAGSTPTTTTYNSNPDCAVMYQVNVDGNVQHGAIGASETEATEGTTVTLTATPDEGYHFGKWAVTKTNTPSVETVEVSNNSFTMPASDVNVTAEFWIDTLIVLATANPTEGGVVTGEDEYEYGTQVTVTATANSGYVFNNWTANGVEVSTNATFTFVVTQDSDLVANFTPDNFTITYKDGNTTLHIDTVVYGDDVPAFADPEKECVVFAGWDGTIPTTMPANNIVVNARWTDIYYTITATAEPANAGQVIMDPEAVVGTTVATSGYQCGTQVTLTANANTGFSFVDWTVNGQSVSTNAELVITAAHDSAFVANFEANNYNITWYLNDGTYNGEALPTTYTYGQAYTLPTANEMSKDNHSFDGWYTNANFSGNAVTAIPDTATGDKAFYAKWTENVYTVNVMQAANGTISADPTSATAGTTINLTATPAQGYHFGYWEVSKAATHVDPVTVTNNSFEMPTSDVYVNAIFWIDTLHITATVNPAQSGTVNHADTLVAYGNDVTLTATPAQDYLFTNWTVNGQAVSADASITITVTQDSAFVANFTLMETVAKPTLLPAGGTFTSEDNVSVTMTCATPNATIYYTLDGSDPVYPRTRNVTGTQIYSEPVAINSTTTVKAVAVVNDMIPSEMAVETYRFVKMRYVYDWNTMHGTVTYDPVKDTAGATITVTATPDEGYSFETWNVFDFDGNDVPVTNNTFIMPDTNVYVSASFTPNTYTVSATVNPANAGTVSGAGDYTFGSDVEMRATPNNEYLFVNWTNTQGTVVSTNPLFDFELQAGDTAFVANFEAKQTVVTPVIQPVSGTYTISANEGMQVTITCETPNSSIYYTLDGTEPTEQSSRYAEGTIISLTQAGTTTVKAIAVADDMLQSATASETYRLVMKHTVMACNPVNCEVQVYKTGTWDLYDTYADTLGANMKVHLDINTLIYNLDTVYANDFDGNPLAIAQVDDPLYNNYGFTMPDTDVCVTAKCSLKQFSVHFVTNGGTLIEYSADTFYVYGQMLMFPTVNEISYEGHTFLGWYDNPNFTGDPMTGLAAGSYADNLYYYAKWDVNSYGLTINYVNENGRPVAPAHTENLDFGDSYNVQSPAVDTYMPDQAVVSGVMGTTAVTVDVIYTQIVMNAIDNQSLCTDATTTQINFTSPVQIGTISYEWTNDNTAIGLDANGTQDNIAAFTAVNAGTEPVVATITVTPLCTLDNHAVRGVPQTFTITVNPKHTSEFSETVCDSYTWNLGDVDTVIVDEGTHDYVHVFANQYGCDSTVTLHLTLYKTPTTITYTTMPNTSCDNAAPNGKITVTAPTGDFEYSLDGIDWQTTTEFADLAANEYTVYVRPVSSECALTQNVTVDDNIEMPLSTPSVAKAFYCLSENIILDGTGSSTGADYTYAWTGPDNYSSTELSPDFDATNGSQSGTYVLTVTNTVTNCVTEASVDVVVNTPTTSDYLFTITTHGDAYANIDEGQTEVTPVFAAPEVHHYLNNTCTTVNDAAATYNTVGDYTINWTSTDECGNTATCTQVLHVTQNVCPVAADADGNTYPAVQLAGKCWMAKNLRTTQFSDGRPVTNLMVYENIMYPNTTENLDRYGYLYDWTTALDAENGVTMDANNNVQGICPTGWHMPTHEDFMSIAGSNTPTDMFDLRYNNYWLDGGGSNSTNYSLLPGGCYNDNTGRYENLLGNAYLWGVNSANPSQPRVYWADCKCYMWQVNDTTEGMGYSVRCIKD